MPDTIQIKLSGRELPPRLPALLTNTARSGSAEADPFLPPGYLTPKSTFDVSSSARSAPDSTAEMQRPAADSDVVWLELADGSTFITSAARLRASLASSHPELLGPNGEILIDKLSDEGGDSRNVFTKAAGRLVSKVFTFVVGGGAADPIADSVKDVAQLGISWAGTKALMWAIERKLGHEPGLYRWVGSNGNASDFLPEALTAAADPAEAAKKPLLVFVHGTASSTLGSFGDLRSTGQDVWAALEARFGQRIYAFEHKTLSESPITNALQLVRALPKGAHVNLVSHSRGGLVADLLCLTDFDKLIDRYRFGFEGIGDPDEDATQRVIKELDTAHAEHRADLQLLAKELREKQLVIQRYVRTASPAHGTLLASGNFDLFLSGILTLIGQVPFLFGSPYYLAFRRVIIDIAKNRTDPHLVPGIEAMLPDSPMAWLLRESPVRPGIQMAVIAGDIQGGNLLKRLGVLLTDFVFFDNVDNDLVVDTPAMLAGIAPKAGSRILFDRGADVSHFRYFTNHDTRAALRDWLTVEKPAELGVFRPLPDRAADLQALQRSTSRDAQAADRPVVVVLPGVMGSHLRVNGDDRVWFDPLDIAKGGLEKISWGKSNVEAEELFGMSYGRLCDELAKTHRVETFPYDWRQPLDVLAERLGEFLVRLMKETDKPIRLLAHSMGGLVVRACIHKRRSVMDELMARNGARFVMLGTPNQGAHSMVENLLGKGSTLRMLVRLDLQHSMQEVLDIVAGFRGALQLLPKKGFKDTFQGQDEGGGTYDYASAQTWVDFNGKIRDLWFGNGRSGKPDQQTLDSASWLWRADGDDKPRLPPEYEKKTTYVFGVAPNTPCGIRDDKGRLRMVGTTRGDGTVTWDSGRIDGIGQTFYMPAEHGDLAATKEYFPALVELLATGTSGQLLTTPPATRDIALPKPLLYDAGPPTINDPDSIERTLLGGSQRMRALPRAKRRLEVSVRAGDLRFVSMPIMVGHYEQDPIVGPEGLIDRELLGGDLSERKSLGLYAGPRGTATVVLRLPNAVESARGSMRGAIVTGLGTYDVPLNSPDLTEAVRIGVLRYLLQVVDVLGKEPREVSLATLLLGYNSTANLSIGASVEALVQGVIDANMRFHQATRLNIRVGRLEIIELYLDTAITAVYALRQMSSSLDAHAEASGTALVCRSELRHDESARQRLFDDRAMNYWPRLMVTDADRRDDLCPPECFTPPCPPDNRNGPRTDDDGDDADGGSNSRAPIAERLRYIYIGSRARAESVMQQRQPGLIETLIKRQIHETRYQGDIGRMLFQLMVPHDLKDAARQLSRLVLVVDSYTANLPWELLLADDPTDPSDDPRPLALRTAVVRQFATSKFRYQVRQAMNRCALVIGNPSVEGFGRAFPGPQGDRADPKPLGQAQAEAEAIAQVLNGLGYTVTPLIGSGTGAVEVFAQLYHQPYRILHISAHGVFGVRHRDGRLRSGVLLSDGLLITAAEIAAMESVPELVFLNCCHLGTVDQSYGGNANKLAASVARELIDIGVRCVIVAGWAVDDANASVFGQTFYQELLRRRRSFGEAVFTARKAAWQAGNGDITWGAFQAYGEPGWMAEPGGDGPSDTDGDPTYVSPDELLDALARVRASISQKLERQTESELARSVEHVLELRDKRAMPAWLALPEVQSALAATWRQLNQLEKARESYLAAIQAEGDLGRVPVRDIEQLANVEALLGERTAKSDASGKSDDAGFRLIDHAIARLTRLGEIVSGKVDGDASTDAIDGSSERNAILGSAWKRKAGLLARQLLCGDLGTAAAARVGTQMDEALRMSAAAYQRAEGSIAGGRLKPYLALNHLALDLLTPWDTPALKEAALALARHCRQAVAQEFAVSLSVWDAAMQADALLVEKLIDGSFAAADAVARQVALDEVFKSYTESFSNLTVKPSELESIVAQIELLARFFAARDAAQHQAVLRRTSRQLGKLVALLQPARSQEKQGSDSEGVDEPDEEDRNGAPAEQAAVAVAAYVAEVPVPSAPIQAQQTPAKRSPSVKGAKKAPAKQPAAKKAAPASRRGKAGKPPKS
ncbi:CHAT domain-containing protein [Variovorax rhizosphaerae]|uniref:CHAT domain-containing protein n=1 Tax=Variovorax rhizosphaerae TaxID=1836200 RepID=A0ABU8WH54_9BURK